MKKIVLTFGSFDVLHPGHLLYLSMAKKLGDRLIVVVARDRSVGLLKHKNTVFDQGSRVKMLNSLKIVDKAVLGNALSKPSERYKIIERYRPAVIAFGYDQEVNIGSVRKWLADHKIKSRIVRIKASVDTNIFKSGKIKKKLYESLE